MDPGKGDVSIIFGGDLSGGPPDGGTCPAQLKQTNATNIIHDNFI